MKTCKTLERLIKNTTIDYKILLKRANKDMDLDILDEQGTVLVREKHTNREMLLYFENNKYNCLIKTKYNYA